MEGDLKLLNLFPADPIHFNPLPPHGGRQRSLQCNFDHEPKFQSTPSAWRETQKHDLHGDFHSISIHSLRMEGDYSFTISRIILRNFNPLPPHGGRLAYRSACRWKNDISIHSLRMEGDTILFYTLKTSEISIHSLRMEGDRRELPDAVPAARRISIHSLRMEGDLGVFLVHALELGISIHSLRMEGDLTFSIWSIDSAHFNPLPPHGGRLIQSLPIPHFCTFQSTPSAWRETYI